MRRDTLALLVAFSQPPVTNQEGGSDALASLLRLERSQSMLSGGRATPVVVNNLKTAFQFRKVPGTLVGPVVRSLLGLLSIRCLSWLSSQAQPSVEANTVIKGWHEGSEAQAGCMGQW